MPAFTGADLARELVDDALRDQELRQSLPLGLDLRDPGQLGPLLHAAATALTRVLRAPDAGRIGRRLDSRFERTYRPEPVRPLATVDALADLGAGQRIRWRQGLDATIEPEGDRVALRLPGRVVRFPGQCTDALRALATGSAAQAGALAGLDEPDSLTVSRRLLREAVVVLEP
jgi:hypothetical protein